MFRLVAEPSNISNSQGFNPKNGVGQGPTGKDRYSVGSGWFITLRIDFGASCYPSEKKIGASC